MRSSSDACGRSRKMRSAKASAASVYASSLSRVSAWSGVFDDERFAVHAVRSTASKLMKLGYGAVRRHTVYTPRRRRAAPRGGPGGRGGGAVRAPYAGWLRRVDRWPPARRREDARDLQGVVADRFG